MLGLGASFAIAYTVSALWVLQILAYKVPGFELRAVLGSLARMVVAAALMGECRVARRACCRGKHRRRSAAAAGRSERLFGVAVYAGLLALMGAPELDALRRRLPGRTRP